MERIVMRVGLDAGLIGPELFTMLLVMAILTTVMTGPLLTLFAGRGTSCGRTGDDVARVEPKAAFSSEADQPGAF